TTDRIAHLRVDELEGDQPSAPPARRSPEERARWDVVRPAPDQRRLAQSDPGRRALGRPSRGSVDNPVTPVITMVPLSPTPTGNASDPGYQARYANTSERVPLRS